MLKEILSISGKPGLFKMVSQAKNMLIVESLTDGKRLPAYTRDKAVSLGDIAIFTNTDEVSLAQVLENLKEKENAAQASIDPKSDNDTLRKYMEEILPDYDKDRVYPSDIRKLLQWYNLLISKGITEFVSNEEDGETDAETKEKEKSVKSKSDNKTSNVTAKKDTKVQAKQPKIAQKPTANRKMGS